jgi:nucleotide-binding universal stress UspA family protein
MDTWSPRTIVVATDGSEQSLRAAGVAAALARSMKGNLLILTVVRPPEGWWGIVGSPPPAESLGNALTDAQKAVLKKTIDSVDFSGIEWEAAEEIGDPATQIVNYATENDADLIVIGQRGAGLVERLMVGSVADRVVHISPVPVLVVP